MKLNKVSAALKTTPLRTTVCVYGAPKSGKSLAIGQLAKYFKLIWFDLENGWEVLLQLPEELQANIELIRLPDDKGYPIAIETIMKLVRGSKFYVCEVHGKASSVPCPICAKSGDTIHELELAKLPADAIVVIDSGSQLSNSALNWVCKGKPDDYKPGYDDWGNMGKLLDSSLSYVQSARFHCIVTAHETEVTMEDDKVKLVPSIGTRNFARNCAKYFSHIVHTEVKNKGHIAASGTTYSNVMLTGSRANVSLEDMKTEYQLAEIFKHYLAKE